MSNLTPENWTPCEHPDRFDEDDPLLWLDLEVADLVGDVIIPDDWESDPAAVARLEAFETVQRMIDLAKVRWGKRKP